MPSGGTDRAVNQKTTTPALSVRPSSRSTRLTLAVTSAAVMATATPMGGKWPPSGRTMMRTPRKPIRTAAQRWMPVGSRRISADRIVPKIGMVKPIVVASAGGNRM